jgi:replicative DNA helicase
MQKQWRKNINDISFEGFKEIIHYNREMEAAVLGACLIEKNAFSLIRGILMREVFYSEGHRIVYDAISEMWEENFPIDILTVISRIARNKNVELLDGNAVPYFVAKLTNAVVSTANIEAHAFILRQLYAERKLLELQHMSFDGEQDVLEKTRRIQDELFKITQIKVSNDWADMIDVVLKLHKHMDEVKDKDVIGIPTGFTLFDRITGGFCKGDMIVIGARPSVGKSAFLGAIAVHAASRNFKVAIISLEMSDVQFGARMGSIVSDVEFYKIFRNRMNDDIERDKVYHKLEVLANLPIKISEKTNVSVSDIKAKVGQLMSKWKPDIVFIDYLQLIDSEDGNRNYNREQEVSKMSRGIKLMAKEFDIPIVALAQLNREAEKTGDKKPKLHHLRESGSIEQDADLVVFLHRDYQSGIETNQNGETTLYEADLIVAKGRNIEKPEIKIGFDPPKMKFYDTERNQFKSLNERTYRDYTQPVKNDNGEDISTTF